MFYSSSNYMINAEISFSGHALNKNEEQDTNNTTVTYRNVVPQYTGVLWDVMECKESPGQC